MKKIILIVLVVSAISFNMNAQNTSLINAFNNSYALEKKGDFSNARKELQTVYNEKSYEINLRMGWLLYNEGEMINSVKSYEKAIALMPYAIEAKLGLVYPLSSLGNWEAVLETYLKILKTDPNNTLINYRTGLIYYNRKEYAKANTYLQKNINLYPFNYDNLILSAWSYLNLGQQTEAKVLFEKCLLFNAEDESAKAGLKLIK
jgi:tetratricopeptide (TPR) repeat protein